MSSNARSGLISQEKQAVSAAGKPKHLRNPDIFERLENRSKRRPLGDISELHNRRHPQKIHKTASQHKAPGLELRPKQKALNPFSFFKSAPKRPDQCLPAVRELSYAFPNREQESSSDTDSGGSYDARRSILYAGPAPEPVRSRVWAMVPYNGVVAQSNALVRAHCDGARLGWEVDGAGDGPYVICSTSAISPVLSVVTTDGGEFLLANTERNPLAVGSRLVLGSCTKTTPKMYTSWKLL